MASTPMRSSSALAGTDQAIGQGGLAGPRRPGDADRVDAARSAGR